MISERKPACVSRVSLPGENVEEFQQLFESLNHEWRPETPLEGYLVNQIAVCIWKLDRLDAVEQFLGETVVHRDPHAAEILWRQQDRLERCKSQAAAEILRLRKVGEAYPPEAGPDAETAERPLPKPAQRAYGMSAASGLLREG